MSARGEVFPARPPGVPAPPGEHLFVYGTLVDPRRLTEVLGHAHRGEVLRARLAGYRRVAPPVYEFPFVVADPEASVEGLLLMDLLPADLDALDAFEDVADGLYCRVPLEVEVFGCGPRPARLAAQAYVAGPALLASLSPAARARHRL